MTFLFTLECIQAIFVLLMYRDQLTRVVTLTVAILEKSPNRQSGRVVENPNPPRDQTGSHTNTSWVAHLFNEHRACHGEGNPRCIGELSCQVGTGIPHPSATLGLPLLNGCSMFCREVIRGSASGPNRISMGLPNTNSFAQQAQQLIEDCSVFYTSIIRICRSTKDARISA